jgi:hypothetical protein
VAPDHELLAGDWLEVAGREVTTLVRRVRGLSPAALGRRREVLDRWLEEARDLTVVAAKRPMPALPDVADHSVADAIAVVGSDLLAALTERPDDAVARALLGVTRAALDATR